MFDDDASTIDAQNNVKDKRRNEGEITSKQSLEHSATFSVETTFKIDWIDISENTNFLLKMSHEIMGQKITSKIDWRQFLISC